MEIYRTARGRILHVYGDPALLTMDRLSEFGARADADPRIVSLSLAPSRSAAGQWLRSAAPAGAAIAIAADAYDMVGPLAALDGATQDGATQDGATQDGASIAAWCALASQRGLWHDWFLTNHADVLKADMLLSPAVIDARENFDTGSSHFFVRSAAPMRGGLRIAVDVTWLGPHETGAQVLTTAALNALADDERVADILLIGLDVLPDYAAHLADRPNIRLTTMDDPSLPADIVWYPNQLDGRSSIINARAVGRRVIATYLDLIAYDIPRYHASVDSWAAYRHLQRTIALSVDGVSTISADVAAHLLEEVPLLEADRVHAIPLGLDHIAGHDRPAVPTQELLDLTRTLSGRNFVLVLGSDFMHKNRDLAIAAWQHVLRQGITCDLVLAGLHVRSSSSRAAEQELLRTHVDLRGTAHVLGHVSSASRAWLLANAAAVLYPSSAEGFGFVPYEAAALGTPATFTNFGPLKEIAGLSHVPANWTIEAYAADLLALLTDQDAAAERVRNLQQVIGMHTWQGFADRLIRFAQDILERPAVGASGLADGDQSAAVAAVLGSRSRRALRPLRAAARKITRS